MIPLLRGSALRRGDTVGIVAPASGFDRAMLARGVARIEALGFRVKLGRNLDAREAQYFAGTAQQRADDLHAMFLDNEVRAIICARGGYGSQGVLALLDLDVVRAHPKPIVGCSDITALQLWLLDQCGLATIHGPMVAGDFARDGGVDEPSLLACLGGEEEWQVAADSGLTGLRDGQASGILWGGCLSLLVSTLETPHTLRGPDQDTILFLEDIAEKPYKIERMFMQWRDAGRLAHVRGIVFGEMLDCEQPDAGYTLREVIKRITASLQVPVAIGLRSGHVSTSNISLPLGVQCTLTCAAPAAALRFTQAVTERA